MTTARRRAALRVALHLSVVVTTLALASCTRFQKYGNLFPPIDPSPSEQVEPLQPVPQQGGPVPDANVSSSSEPDFYQPGTDTFAARLTPAASRSDGDGEITLNFENTNLLEVVKVVLSDLLGLSYVVAPGVQGTVTLQSSQPVSREALLPTLELLLRMNGAALVASGGEFRVLPREQAIRGGVSAQLGDSSEPLPGGYSVRVVPLKFISATEMRAIIEPVADPGAVLRVDSARNMLLLAGSSNEMQTLLETVEVFDVDWMAGMSVALFRPDFVDAETLAAELEQALGTGADGPAQGLIRFVPIERLNGLLVVTPRRAYLSRVRQWVERLDRADVGVGRRLYVYHVQNGKAADLAEVLSQVFDQQSSELPAAEVAPGLQPARLGSGAPVDVADAASADRSIQDAVVQALQQNIPGGERQGSVRPTSAGATAGDGVVLSDNSSVRIIPDEVNNSLLIMATAGEYRQVEAALRQLDLAPLQVLVEATIAEVQLTDELSQGLEWFLKNNFGSKRGTALLDNDDTPDLAALIPGFSYAITDSAAIVRAVLNTLASQSRARVVSSPSLMVLNNQTATIQVGDEVPVTTQRQQTTNTDSNILNSIEYRNTGVTLVVTPRVNSGGLVTMEVEQEVSNVAPNSVDPLAPTIRQRSIVSTVAVQSGETVVLGGLIREQDDRTDAGVPVVREIPVLGWFFGSSRDALSRTELVVLITPRAIRGSDQARSVTGEFRSKMESLKPGDDVPRGFGPFYHRLDTLKDLVEPDDAPVLPAPPPAKQSLNELEQEHALRMERMLDPERPSRSRPRPEPMPAPVALALSRDMGVQGVGGVPSW